MGAVSGGIDKFQFVDDAIEFLVRPGELQKAEQPNSFGVDAVARLRDPG